MAPILNYSTILLFYQHEWDAQTLSAKPPEVAYGLYSAEWWEWDMGVPPIVLHLPLAWRSTVASVRE